MGDLLAVLALAALGGAILVRMTRCHETMRRARSAENHAMRLYDALEEARVNLYTDLYQWIAEGHNPDAMGADFLRHRIATITEVLCAPVDRNALPDKAYMHREADAIEFQVHPGVQRAQEKSDA